MECPICLEHLKGHGKTYTTECNHTFHKKCFGKLQKRVCPCCRAVIPKDKKTQILEMENEIRVIVRDFKQNKQIRKDNFSKNSKEMKVMQTHLKNEIKILQTIVKKGLNSSFDSINIQTEKIQNLTTLLEEKQQIVRQMGMHIRGNIYYYENIISFKKDALRDLVNSR